MTRDNYSFSVGGGLWNVTYTPQSGSDFSMLGAMARGAYELSRSLAVEAHFGLTDSDTQNVFSGAVPVSLRVNALGGVFAKLSWVYSGDRDGWARIYGLLGYSMVEVEAKSQGQTANDSDSGPSFGVGIDLFGSDRTAVVLEWVRYIEQNDFDIDAGGLSIIYRF